MWLWKRHAQYSFPIGRSLTWPQLENGANNKDLGLLACTVTIICLNFQTARETAVFGKQKLPCIFTASQTAWNGDKIWHTTLLKFRLNFYWIIHFQIYIWSKLEPLQRSSVFLLYHCIHRCSDFNNNGYANKVLSTCGYNTTFHFMYQK